MLEAEPDSPLSPLEKHHQLRRAGDPRGPPGSPAEGRRMPRTASFKAKEPQEGLLLDLMRFTLKDKKDSVRTITMQLEDFKRAREDATPSMHATCHIADRVLQVMEKKLELMEQVGQKAGAYQEAKKDVESTLRRATDGADMREEMAAAEGFREFVREVVGESQDFDEKADWPLFLRNIKLPNGHSTAAAAKKLLNEGEEEWSQIAMLLCQQQAETVLLPAAERQRRAEERRKRRIFMRAFPETLDGVTAEQVEAVHKKVHRIFTAACSFGNLREKSAGYEELAQLEQDLQTQLRLLKTAGDDGVKLKM